MPPRDQQRARMMAAATRRTEPDAAPAGKTAIRSKPVRITVDLNPNTYRQLAEWTSAAAAELDVPRLTSADAIRAMIMTASANRTVSSEVLQVLRMLLDNR